MNNMKDILEKVYSNINLRKSVIPLFMGNPGLGKTRIIKEFAEEKKVKLNVFVTATRAPYEISGMAIPDKDLKKMSYWDFDMLLGMKDGDILFFDEVWGGNIATLNACLTLLESREMVSGRELPNIMIVAAGNEQGLPQLDPQIKERFVWYNTIFDSKMWINYMKNKYNMPNRVSLKLCSLIKKEDFTGRNYDTPRSIDKAVEQIIHSCPTPYFEKLKDILETFFENKLEEKIVVGDVEIKPGEMVKWLDLVKLKINNKI